MIAFTDAQLLDWIAGLLLPMFRVLALFMVAPVLSNRAVPLRLRIALSGAVALAAAPSAPLPPGSLPLDASLAALVGYELLIGLTIGFVARLLFAAFEIAGEAIGLQAGLSFAGFFDPQSGSANAVGRFIGTTALLAFVALNGPLVMIATVIQSFDAFPPGGANLALIFERSPVALGTDVFVLALNIALPFIALLLFVNIALGVVSRVAPQFNIFAVGFPITIAAGLVLLTLALHAVLAPLADAVEHFLNHPYR